MATTTNPVCTINADTRIITVPAEYKELGVESDERATRVNFRCPKIVGDGIDLSTLNLYINYENANKKLNSYLVDDVTVSGSNIEFSWLLSRHVTEASGTVRYIVCAKKSDDTEVVNEWNTKVATGTVNAGLEATAEIEEQNVDIIEQILKCIVELENNSGGSSGGSSDITLGLTSASVGQIAKIAAVGTGGKPTKWEATDITAGKDGTNGKDGVTPTIGSNGNWYLGTVDTGKPSQGADGTPGAAGHSPVVTATKEGSITTIKVDGTAIAAIHDGSDGTDGKDGTDGAPGAAGHSPVVAATKSEKTTTITVDGKTIATISDGADGTDGAPGKDGTNGTNGKDGTDGKDGVTPTIGTNGNWYIGDTDTGKPSRGAAGTSGDDIPDYVQTAADALAKKVTGHIGVDNIVFAVMADAHLGYYTDTENAAGKQAGQALERLNNRCALDFVAHVGDYSTGAWNTTVDSALEDNADYQLLIGSKFHGKSVWCAGNHDDTPYQATASRLTQTQMYAAIGRKNLIGGGNVPGNACYGYMDFPGLRLRVIYLDTHDRRSWGSAQVGSGAECNYLNVENISADQLQYIAEHALDFSGVSDPAQWSILVFSHAALNTSGTYTDTSGTVHSCNTTNATALLRAYAKKKSGTISHDKTVTYDFSQTTPAQIIAFIHGHEHRYADETVGEEFLSICCPNIMNGRERASADGNTYSKTTGTANGTAFCVFSINRVEKKIYVDHYGAGIDREFSYTVPDPNVNYTNVLTSATDTDGSVYNASGWASGYRLNSSGAAEGMTGMYLTGFIPVAMGDVVRLKNITWQNGVSSGDINSGNQRVSFYDSSKTQLGQTNGIAVAGTLSGIKDDNSIWTQFTVKSWSGATITDVAYFRLCCAGISDDSIITVNEEIT